MSIRSKIALQFLLLFAGTLILFCFLIFQAFVRTHQQEFDNALFNHTVDIARSIQTDVFGRLSVGNDALTATDKILPFLIPRTFVEVRELGGNVLAKSQQLGKSEIPFPQDISSLVRGEIPAIIRTIEFKELARAPELLAGENRRSNYRVITYLITNIVDGPYFLQVAVPMTLLNKERTAILTFFLISVPLILAIAAVGGLYFSRRAFRPVGLIVAKANSISAKDLSERLPVEGDGDELALLSNTINGLLDRLEKAFKSQERFIADASHQIKTPLSILRGELDVFASRERTKEETQEFLQSAKQELQFMGRMIEDLLILARFDAGVSELRKKEVRLDELLLQVVGRLERGARAENVRIRVALPEVESSLSVQGDGDLLESLFTNLIENAVKYSPKSGLVEVKMEEAPSNFVIRVRDEGPGISLEDQKHLFDRFYRGKTSANERQPGVGLGLAIAKRVADAHGAELYVQSVLGRGTTMVVEIKKI